MNKADMLGLLVPLMFHNLIECNHKEDGIDYVKEYELIKQKKSLLSANKRKGIVAYMEKRNKEDLEWEHTQVNSIKYIKRKNK